MALERLAAILGAECQRRRVCEADIELAARIGVKREEFVLERAGEELGWVVGPSEGFSVCFTPPSKSLRP